MPWGAGGALPRELRKGMDALARPGASRVSTDHRTLQERRGERGEKGRRRFPRGLPGTRHCLTG